MPRERFQIDASKCRFDVQPPAGADKAPTLSGYAIVWGVTSGDRGGYVARMAKGSGTPDAGGVQALYAHDSQKVLGSTANGTLKLTADDYGVKCEITPPDTTYAKDVTTLVRDKYVQGMSFGMIPEQWTDTTENGQDVRTFTKFTFDEVTITGIPAFSETTIGAAFQRVELQAETIDVDFDDARFRFIELDD